MSIELILITGLITVAGITVPNRFGKKIAKGVNIGIASALSNDRA